MKGLKNKKIRFTKQSIFLILAVIFLILIAWFGVSNFVFLVDNLNKAVNPTVDVQVETLKFDKEKFESLELSR